MGIYHRIWKKLAIWDSEEKIQNSNFAYFHWKFWISRMKSWSNTIRWNFMDLKVWGRLTSIQLFIETVGVSSQIEKRHPEAQKRSDHHLSWRFALEADALSDLIGEIHPKHPFWSYPGSKQSLFTLCGQRNPKRCPIFWARILMRTRRRIGTADI